jgi:hypothetical protein
VQELIILLVAWSAFGALPSAWLADQKGHSVRGWFVAGLVLGPLAVLTVGLAPRGFGDGFKACVECCEAIYSDATKCPYCGTDLIADAEDG